MNVITARMLYRTKSVPCEMRNDPRPCVHREKCWVTAGYMDEEVDFKPELVVGCDNSDADCLAVVLLCDSYEEA